MNKSIKELSKLKSQIKSESKSKKLQINKIIPVTIGIAGILSGFLLINRKNQRIVKKLDIKHEIAMRKIIDLEEKLKKEKVLHQILIRNLNEKEEPQNQKQEEFKRATINKDKIQQLTKELEKIKKEKDELDALIKKYDTVNKKYENIQKQMKSDLDKFVKNEQFLISELKNKDKKIHELISKVSTK